MAAAITPPLPLFRSLASCSAKSLARSDLLSASSVSARRRSCASGANLSSNASFWASRAAWCSSSIRSISRRKIASVAARSVISAAAAAHCASALVTRRRMSATCAPIAAKSCCRALYRSRSIRIIDRCRSASESRANCNSLKSSVARLRRSVSHRTSPRRRPRSASESDICSIRDVSSPPIRRTSPQKASQLASFARRRTSSRDSIGESEGSSATDGAAAPSGIGAARSGRGTAVGEKGARRSASALSSVIAARPASMRPSVSEEEAAKKRRAGESASPNPFPTAVAARADGTPLRAGAAKGDRDADAKRRGIAFGDTVSAVLPPLRFGRADRSSDDGLPTTAPDGVTCRIRAADGGRPR